MLSVMVTQAEFAELVGISEAKASQLIAEGVLTRGEPCIDWLRSYINRLREQAAGRMGDGEGLDLVQERAALAREMREGHAIKNAVARGDYAPIGLLTDVLGMASAAVVDRFDSLPGLLRKTCPDLPTPARETLAKVIAEARNEWIRSTAALVVKQLQDAAVEEDGDAPTFDDVPGAE